MKEEGVFLIFSLGVGIAANVLVVTALWSIGELYFLFVLPIFAGGIAIAGFRRANLADREICRNAFDWILGTLFVCVTALLGVGFIYSGDFVNSYSMHAAFQGVIMRGLELGWPPPNLLLPEVAWSYNYAAHLWLHGVMLTTGLPIDVLVTRYGPVFLGGASAALMLAFGRYLVGLAWWIAILPVICVYSGDWCSPHCRRIIRQLYAVWSQSNSIAVSGHFDIFPGPYIRFGKAERARFLSRSSCHARHAYISGDRCERCLSPDPALCIVAPAGCDELAKERLDRKNLIHLGAALIGFAASSIFLHSWNRILRRGRSQICRSTIQFPDRCRSTGADAPSYPDAVGTPLVTFRYRCVCCDRCLSSRIPYARPASLFCGNPKAHEGCRHTFDRQRDRRNWGGSSSRRRPA